MTHDEALEVLKPHCEAHKMCKGCSLINKCVAPQGRYRDEKYDAWVIDMANRVMRLK